MVHTIRLNRNEHVSLLADHRVDPYSKKLLEVGDEVVVCAKCKNVFLKDVWVGSLRDEHCDQRETLASIPNSEFKATRSNNAKQQNSGFAIVLPWVIAGILALVIVLNIESYNDYKSKAAKVTSLENSIASLEQKVSALTSSKYQLEKREADYIERLNSLQAENSRLKDSLLEKSSLIEELQYDPFSSLSYDAQAYKNSISNFYKSPILIENIEFKSITSDNRISIPYGETLRQSSVYYLCPRITYTGITSKRIKLKAKITEPNGSIMRNYSSSPNGFTYECELYCYSGRNYGEVLGWGSDTGNSYSQGWYEIEFWYENVCIGFKRFYIYDY